jgi:hypothetical protein
MFVAMQYSASGSSSVIENIFYDSTPTTLIPARVLSMSEPVDREPYHSLSSMKCAAMPAALTTRRALLRGRSVSHCGRALSTMMDIPQMALPLLLR